MPPGGTEVKVTTPPNQPAGLQYQHPTGTAPPLIKPTATKHCSVNETRAALTLYLVHPLNSPYDIQVVHCCCRCECPPHKEEKYFENDVLQSGLESN